MHRVHRVYKVVKVDLYSNISAGDWSAMSHLCLSAACIRPSSEHMACNGLAPIHWSHRSMHLC